MKYKNECKYCGHTWLSIYKPDECIKCNDQKIKINHIEKSNVFGYEDEPEEELVIDWSSLQE